MQSEETHNFNISLDNAIALHRVGRLEDAQKIYSLLLDKDPANIDVLQLWGMLATQTSQNQLALELAQNAVKICPQDAFVHCTLGMALYTVGRPVDAVKSLDYSVHLNPNNAEAYCVRGMALEKLGQLLEALKNYETATTLNPQYAEAYFNQGNMFQLLKRYSDAVQKYELAIRCHSQYAQAYNNLGNAFKALEKYSSAVSSYEQAILIDPDFADAYNNRGVVLVELGSLEAASDSYTQAIRLDSKNPDFYLNQGNLYNKVKSYELAIKSYRYALLLDPDNSKAFCGLGNAYKYDGTKDGSVQRFLKSNIGLLDLSNSGNSVVFNFEALDYADRVLLSYLNTQCIRSSCQNCNQGIGQVLEDLQRIQTDSCGVNLSLLDIDQETCTSCNRLILNFYNHLKAFICFFKATSIDPSDEVTRNNCAVLFSELGLLKDSLYWYDKAIALKPDYAEAFHNKSMTLLLGGFFEVGWKLYEWRWQKNNNTFRPRSFNVPLWLGDVPIQGKTILIHCEQGYGDTLQFCRYMPLLKGLGARVIFSVPKPLQTLMQTLNGVDVVLEDGKSLLDIDFHCPLLSLPLAFKTKISSVPAPLTYLDSEPSKVEQWKNLLGEKTCTRVGLTWCGNPNHINDHNRSIALEMLLDYLPRGFDYISLQKGHTAKELSLLQNNSHVRQFGDCLDDFSDTAALTSIMDIVISVDTSVAHLAGSLGKTTWILLPYAPDWRWMLHRKDSPWYPSVRLYRQDESMSWMSVMEQVRADLCSQVW